MADATEIKASEEGWRDCSPRSRALIRADCILAGRCPLCTMLMPCPKKHFETVKSFIENGWFTTAEWESLPKEKRAEFEALKKELAFSYDGLLENEPGEHRHLKMLFDVKRDLKKLKGNQQAIQA